jgi:hypothetical protein
MDTLYCARNRRLLVLDGSTNLGLITRLHGPLRWHRRSHCQTARPRRFSGREICPGISRSFDNTFPAAGHTVPPLKSSAVNSMTSFCPSSAGKRTGIAFGPTHRPHEKQVSKLRRIHRSMCLRCFTPTLPGELPLRAVARCLKYTLLRHRILARWKTLTLPQSGCRYE